MRRDFSDFIAVLLSNLVTVWTGVASEFFQVFSVADSWVCSRRTGEAWKEVVG